MPGWVLHHLPHQQKVALATTDTRNTPCASEHGKKKDGVMPGTTRKPPSSVLAKDTRRLKATNLGVSSGYHPGNRHMTFTTPCVNRHQNEERQ